jgi:hypothetical protein
MNIYPVGLPSCLYSFFSKMVMLRVYEQGGQKSHNNDLKLKVPTEGVISHMYH